MHYMQHHSKMWSIVVCFAGLLSPPVHPGRYQTRPRPKSHHGPSLQPPPGALESQSSLSPLSSEAGKGTCGSGFRWSQASAALWSSAAIRTSCEFVCAFVAATCFGFVLELLVSLWWFGWEFLMFFRVLLMVSVCVHLALVFVFYCLLPCWWIVGEVRTQHRTSRAAILRFFSVHSTGSQLNVYTGYLSCRYRAFLVFFIIYLSCITSCI